MTTTGVTVLFPIGEICLQDQKLSYGISYKSALQLSYRELHLVVWKKIACMMVHSIFEVLVPDSYWWNVFAAATAAMSTLVGVYGPSKMHSSDDSPRFSVKYHRKMRTPLENIFLVPSIGGTDLLKPTA
ncbi:hypothetical protein Tco_0077820 [Tanacetum coccineum]